MNLLMSRARINHIAATGDPLWADVVLLCHCDGADTSTTLTDVAGHTFTPAGTAQISTSQKVFGTGSAVMNGSASYWNTPASSDWNFGTGEFTVEMRIRFNSLPASNAFLLIGNYESTSLGWYLQFRNDGADRLTFGPTGDSPQFDADWSPSTDTWYHIAVCRDGSNNLRFFVDGTQVGSTSSGFTYNITGSTDPLSVGALYQLGIQYFDGWMDEIRITKAARYTANFTPAAAAFPDN